MQGSSQPFNPATANFYGNFVQTAYAVYQNNPTNLNPSQEDYTTLPQGYQVLLNIQMTDFFGNNEVKAYYGFMAQNTANPSEIVVAIRGTSNWIEWWDDFHWDLIPYPYAGNGGNVASGFIDIYESFVVSAPGSTVPLMKLKDTINSLDKLKSGATSSLTIAGHSLGSSLVTLYASQLAAQNQVSPVVYTFASPRVGDGTFATFYNNLINNNYRIYNWPDIVPYFPKDPFDNYQHVAGGQEYDFLDYLTTVKVSVECFHSLNTYQFLLGAPASILGGIWGCGY